MANSCTFVTFKSVVRLFWVCLHGFFRVCLISWCRCQLRLSNLLQAWLSQWWSLHWTMNVRVVWRCDLIALTSLSRMAEWCWQRAAGLWRGRWAPESVAPVGKKEVKGSYVSIHSSGFRDFLLKPELLRAIVDCGFEHPSEGKRLRDAGSPNVNVLISILSKLPMCVL